MTIIIIKFGSTAYKQMIALRMEVLWKPLGLTFTEDNLQREKEDTLIGVFENKELAGCCVLTRRNNMAQLRQMAVAPARQGKGIGLAIIRFAEELVKKQRYAVLMMHARKEAVSFYKKCGYTRVGNEFTEVGIPHYKMEKHL